VRVRQGGAWRTISGGRVRVGGAWRTLVRAQTFVGGVWRNTASFTQPLTLSISPDPVTRSVTEGTTGETGNVTASPTGGRAPITYAWTRVSGDTSITITAPSAAVTRFSRFVPDESIYSAVFQCTATDADGRTASDTVTVEIFGIIDPVGGTS